jgi:tryptophan-rich sensory protein
MMKKAVQIILCILLPLSVGALSGMATTNGLLSWYPSLHKPFFNPPNFLFGPVWTLLYVLMGISFYIILQSKDLMLKRRAVIIFGIQLVFNFFWSFIFFENKLLGWALVEIIILWLLLIGMIASFYGIDKRAGLLQIPYLLWVSFAALLNGAIVYLN